MQQILTVTTPFFALVLLGRAVVRLRVLPLDPFAAAVAWIDAPAAQHRAPLAR